MKIAIFGATGLIGTYLTKELQSRKIIVLSFSRKGPFFWDPEKEVLDLDLLQDVDVVINLTGESIQGRWTWKKKSRIRKSRVETTEFLVKRLLCLKKGPSLYIGASAIGYYGMYTTQARESDPPGEDFLAKLTRDWEEKTKPLENTRVVLMRLGAVLAPDGGMLKPIKTLFQWFLGTKFGSGKQMMSWVSIDDVVSAVIYSLSAPLSGPVNLVSPYAVSQEEFLQLVAKILDRPSVFSFSEKWVKRIFGEASSLVLSDQVVLPEKLLESGFHFSLPRMEDALKKYLIFKR